MVPGAYTLRMPRACATVYLIAPVVKLADTSDLSSDAERRAGSTPVWGMDLIGKVYGRLTVLEPDLKKSNKKRKYVICQCICKNIKSVLRDNLVGGKTKSCGCLVKESQLKQAKQRKQYEEDETELRHIWRLMMRRCYNPADAVYKHYGGRGIEVDSPWHSYEEFKKDMYPRKPDTSLERIDNNKNYSSKNCKWGTKEEQANNRRGNRLETLDGTTKTLAQWCKEYNKSYSKVHQRLARGWLLEKALTED